jgi:hypothetical protein
MRRYIWEDILSLFLAQVLEDRFEDFYLIDIREKIYMGRILCPSL